MSSDIKAPWVYPPVQQRDGNRAFKNTLEQKKYTRKTRVSKELATGFPSPPSSQVRRKREFMEIEKPYSPDENKSMKIEEEEEEEAARSSYLPNKSMEMVDDLEFMQASSVNVFNFVSVKLSGKSNYIIWKAQMICLLKNQKMHGAIIEDQTGKYWRETKSDKILKQYDDLFKGWIFASLNEKVFDRVKAYDSGSIVWKELESLYDPISSAPKDADGPDPGREHESSVEVVVPKHNNNTELQLKLRDVTLEGRWWKARSILKRHKDAATTETISDHGDTMLHLAVREGKNYLVEKLLNFIHDGTQVENKNADGQTALHIAAIVGNIDAAKLLVKKRGIELLNNPDTGLKLPFASAYFNGQVSTFEYLWEATENTPEYCLPEKAPKYRCPEDLIIDENENPIDLLSIFICEKNYHFAKKLLTIRPNLATEYPSPLTTLTENFPSDITFVEELIKPPSLKNVHENIVKRGSSLFYSLEYLLAKAEDSLWAMRWFRNKYYSRLLPEIVMIILSPVGVLYPIYQLMRLLILLLLYPFIILYFLLWKVFAIVAGPIKRIEKKKKEYEEAKEFLKLICNHFKIKGWDMPASAPGIYNGVFYHKYYSIPILTAVSLDVSEVVDQILCCSSEAIGVKNMEGHNIIQSSIVSRSEKVYNLIRPKIQSSEFYRELPDSSGNNLLHLVGRLAPSVILSHTTGAALQLQRELQWREEVEKLMESTQLTDPNVDKETPEVVFTREHTDLVMKGEQWMKTTAESCSITAALIVTIVFAAAITVPGGSNQETGIPLFKKEIAFLIFALSDAISLFTAATSLLVFLSILTTRFAQKDFLLSLPRRLLIALCFLFLSTIAMLLAFCAILFLVFCDHRPWMLAPIGALACLPIVAIVTLQLPLVVDLYRSTYSPLFGEQQKRRSAPYKEE